jgi:pimeloyl-ACP methyl ester carboxylesterase
MGHSWGAALGLPNAQAHPDKVSAFIGVNPVISTREGQLAEYDIVLAGASRRKENGALAHLRKIGPPPYIGTVNISARKSVTFTQRSRLDR